MDGIGSTEMLHIFISNSITNITPGSSGKPVPGYRAKIIKDDNTEAGIDEIGELEIKGPSSAIKYWNKPEKVNILLRMVGQKLETNILKVLMEYLLIAVELMIC